MAAVRRHVFLMPHAGTTEQQETLPMAKNFTHGLDHWGPIWAHRLPVNPHHTPWEKGDGSTWVCRLPVNPHHKC